LNAHQLTAKGLDGFEVMFHLITFSYIFDELVKFYHVGWNYFGFINIFNDVMYLVVMIAIGFRYTSFQHIDPRREKLDEMSFRILSCAAPFMWTRFLLYLDAQKFVGAMIVVIKVMMRESILFFFLLSVIILGFLQGFLGLDASDGESNATQIILISLIKSVVGDSSFEDFSIFVPPYASVLYYTYSFLLTVILMNILIALYSSAYANIVDNATDEYLALVAQKTLRYIRAPDADLYVPPLNLIEIAITPLSWVLSRKSFKTMNYFIMLVLYSPLLTYITVYELSNARRIQYNRYKKLPDDANEFDTEWDISDGYDDSESNENSIHQRNLQVEEALRNQREGEDQDPDFRINVKNFEKEIDQIVQPVEIASKMGVPWELYTLHFKIDTLTKLVENVITENIELKKKVKELDPNSK
jgi:hypothetical protein